MQNDDSEIAANAASIESQVVAGDLAKHRSKILFETLVTRLGCGHGHADFVRFFDARMSYQQVVDWRRGRARIPNWVWEYLESRLVARAQTDMDFAKQCRKADRQRRANNIAKFNARRFAPQGDLLPKKKEAGG